MTRARTFEPSYGAKRAAWRAAATARSEPGARDSLRSRALRVLAQAARGALFPDPQVLWQPGAQAALALRLARKKDDVVLISGPPFSQFLLAPLARAGGLGVVLDYRDEWITLRSAYEMGKSSIARALGDPVESVLLRRAHAVTTATDEFRSNLIARFPFLDAARVFAVPNGYDLDDFPRNLPDPPGDRFTVTYAGTVFALTSARGLLGAVRRLHARSPELARLLRLRFLGRVVETELDAFDGVEALGVERAGYVPHAQVVRELAASQMTLCLLDDVPGAERIYPAKVFELMVLGRPVLTLAAADTALARLVEQHRLGPRVHPRDEEAIATLLRERLRAFRDNGNRAESWQNGARTTRGLDRFDRRALAGEMADILRGAASSARRSRSWPSS
ncbi:MAG: glycosyltransferase [Polyangiaceae bacterium]